MKGVAVEGSFTGTAQADGQSSHDKCTKWDHPFCTKKVKIIAHHVMITLNTGSDTHVESG